MKPSPQHTKTANSVMIVLIIGLLASFVYASKTVTPLVFIIVVIVVCAMGLKER